ncbi:tetratricopeptide repeat protein [Hydrogenophaga sp. 5NK40-0174]
MVLAGCAQQRIRDQASESIRSGEYEKAVALLREGVAEYPESALLRAGLASAETDIVGRQVAEVAQARAASRHEEVEKIVNRSLAIYPHNARMRTLKQDLQRDRLTRDALAQATELDRLGKQREALGVVDRALALVPGDGELSALRRKIEAGIRWGQAVANQHRLANTKPISLSMRNAPLGSLLDVIRDGTGVNFVVDRDVKLDQSASVFIREAQVEDAIDLVLSAFQLSRRIIDEKTVLVYPDTPEKRKQHQEQVIRVFHLANADAKATASFLQSMLKIQPPYVDEAANMLALREPPEIVALAERLIGLHDLAGAEVMLDVEIMEIKTTRLTELGINFPNSLSFSLLPLSGQSGVTVDAFNSLNVRGGLNNVDYSRVGLSVGSLLINLRREVGDFNTLANPRIRARSREKATIMVGDKVPVITTTAASSGSFVSESVNYLDVGLKLDVEPVVSPDDEVTIKLALEVSSVAGEIKSATGTVAYQIGTRNATTTLRLRDGETQLLGGLISNEERSAANRLPGLGDLPIAGRLFSSQKDDNQRTELVLAITPRILRNAPRPDASQAEMWVGTEKFTRLRQPPMQRGLKLSSQMGQLPTATVAATAASGANARSGEQAEADQGNESQALNLVLEGPKEVKVGEEFDVALEMKSGASVVAIPMDILFTADAFEVLAVQEGGYFKEAGASSSFTHAVNKKDGRISIGLLSNADKGVKGEGRLLIMRLKALKPGKAEPIRFKKVEPLSAAGAVAPEVLPVLSIDVKP